MSTRAPSPKRFHWTAEMETMMGWYWSRGILAQVNDNDKMVTTTFTG
jgi:hypothetical protein